MSATGHRPLSRPGRGPRHTRPVHDQGPVPACAAPSRSAGPAGEVEAEAEPLRGRARSPTAVRCSKRGGKPGPLSTTRRAHRLARAGHGASQAGRSPPTTARCGGPGTRGIHPPARSRPHGKNDQATIETREATTWCAATPPRYRHGHRRRAPGAGPPAGAGPAPGSTPPTPIRKPIGWGTDRAGERKRPQANPAHPRASCRTPMPRPTPRRTN